MPVDVYGVRHHGPGSARAVRAALEEQPPDLVLIEGCPELDAIVGLLGEADIVPPVAGLVYAVEQPRQATFYPLARFSPEWVAARWALAHGVPVRFLDLPATHAFALAQEVATAPEPTEDGAESVGSVEEPAVPAERLDPIGTLAATAGYDDAERWWEDAVEQRHGSPAERFVAIRHAMAAVRSADTRPDDDPEVRSNARREQWMRRVLRAEIKAAPEARIAVVCGAWHAPALVPADFPPASRDADLITKLPRTKVAAAWTPWTAPPAQLRLRLRRRRQRAGVVPAPLRPPEPSRPLPRRPRHVVAGPGRPHPARGAARRLDRLGGGGRPPRRDPGRRPRSPVRRARRARRRRARPCCARGPGCRSPGHRRARRGRGARHPSRVRAGRPARRRPRPPAAVAAAQAHRRPDDPGRPRTCGARATARSVLLHRLELLGVPWGDARRRRPHDRDVQGELDAGVATRAGRRPRRGEHLGHHRSPTPPRPESATGRAVRRPRRARRPGQHLPHR